MSTYNKNITDKLCNRAQSELKKSGYKKISIIEVPGSFEVPTVISKIINKYDGFIAIGCIIKGETANFDLISNIHKYGRLSDVRVLENRFFRLLLKK